MLLSKEELDVTAQIHPQIAEVCGLGKSQSLDKKHAPERVFTCSGRRVASQELPGTSSPI